MKTKTIVAAALFTGAIVTATFAHGNNRGSNQNMQNGMNKQADMQNQHNMINMMHNMMHGMMQEMHNSSSSQNYQNCLNNQNGMQNQPNMMGSMSGMMMHNNMPLFSKLNLNNEQKNKLFTLHQEMMNKMQTVMHPKGSNGMMDFITNNGFDKDSFRKTMNDRHQTMMDFKINHMDQVLKILTKEQLSQLSK